MEDLLKITTVLIVLTLVLSYAFNLLNSFITYSRIKGFSNDLVYFSDSMSALKNIGSKGSFNHVKINIPEGYSLFFNNVSDVLEIHGLEEFNLTINNDVLYSLNLSKGIHEIQLYYGSLSFTDLKNETVVFN